MKQRVVASASWDIEVTEEEINEVLNESIAEGYDVSDWNRGDIATDIAYDKLQKMTFAEASWNNIQEWYNLDEAADRIENA